MKNPSIELSEKVWPIAEAKARLSEILRRAEEEGPQQVGVKKTFVIMPLEAWEAAETSGMSLGEMIMKFRPNPEDLPERGLEIPKREGGHRPIPFIDYDVE
ncbi:MAG: type II toxin-antitoxin system prevent-host-death family antitoxin [Gammaproteobacteria bacterium]|nr:type II toxin-antitoxin system prevent-host-death family antitoxin [Gammaproteobacteria bacterium]